MIGYIKNAMIFIKPSRKLDSFIKQLEFDQNMPEGINSIRANIIINNNDRNQTNLRYLLNDEDKEFISQLKLIAKPVTTTEKKVSESAKLLNLEDLYWLNNKIEYRNKSHEDKIYLHDFIMESEIILPENIQIPRNLELEKRCQTLRAQQQNYEYKTMTKNVDCVRKKHPEDTISYQS